MSHDFNSWDGRGFHDRQTGIAGRPMIGWCDDPGQNAIQSLLPCWIFGLGLYKKQEVDPTMTQFLVGCLHNWPYGPVIGLIGGSCCWSKWNQSGDRMFLMPETFPPTLIPWDSKICILLIQYIFIFTSLSLSHLQIPISLYHQLDDQVYLPL